MKAKKRNRKRNKREGGEWRRMKAKKRSRKRNKREDGGGKNRG